METIGLDPGQMQRTPLADAHVDALRESGTRWSYPKGTRLVSPDDPIDRFTSFESCEIEVVDAYTGERAVPNDLGRGR